MMLGSKQHFYAQHNGNLCKVNNTFPENYLKYCENDWINCSIIYSSVIKEMRNKHVFLWLVNLVYLLVFDKDNQI